MHDFMHGMLQKQSNAALVYVNPTLTKWSLKVEVVTGVIVFPSQNAQFFSCPQGMSQGGISSMYMCTQRETCPVEPRHPAFPLCCCFYTRCRLLRILTSAGIVHGGVMVPDQFILLVLDTLKRRSRVSTTLYYISVLYYTQTYNKRNTFNYDQAVFVLVLLIMKYLFS